MARETILVVDDEPDILELIRFNLEREGYQVETVSSGEEALVAATKLEPDVVVLDLMLPGLDGIEVCRRLKRETKTERIPVLMLTAKAEDTDIVTGLEIGADDYITKPFSPKVLIARIRAAVRRTRDTAEAKASETIRILGITIHTSRHEVFVDDVPVQLSATEFSLLEFLASRPGWVFTRSQIIDAIRGPDYAVTARAVDVHVLGLRRKLGRHGSHIETVRGVGYRMQESAQETPE